MISIRFESSEDYAAVRDINEQAFGQPLEAGIVEEVRRNCPEALLLVAEDSGEVVGHIMFSPVVIADSNQRVAGMGLGPMAVLPIRQRQGIGTELVKKGLRILRNRNYPFVSVLGHPEYYPRFGFEKASKFAVKSQWDGIPDEVFMILLFNRAILPFSSGVAIYRDEFNDAT